MTKHDVLCQCGWGQLAIEEEDIPESCPVCGFDLWEYANNQRMQQEETVVTDDD